MGEQHQHLSPQDTDRSEITGEEETHASPLMGAGSNADAGRDFDAADFAMTVDIYIGGS